MATSPDMPQESYFSIVKAQVEKNGGSINLEGEKQYQNMFIEYFEEMRKMPKHNTTIKAVAYISTLTKVPITYQVGITGVTGIDDSNFSNGIKVVINFEQIKNEDVYPYLVIHNGKISVACVRHPPHVVIGHENGHIYRLGMVYQKLRQSEDYSSKPMEQVLKKAIEIVGVEDFNAKMIPYVQYIIQELETLVNFGSFEFSTDINTFELQLNELLPQQLYNKLDDDTRKLITFDEWISSINQLFWGGHSKEFTDLIGKIENQTEKKEINKIYKRSWENRG